MNEPEGPVSKVSEAEFQSMMASGERHKLLHLAVVVIKVLAFLYVVIGVGSLFLADDDKKLEGIALALAIFRDVLVAFFIYVSGDVIKLQLEIKEDVTKIRGGL